jgi:hypothetical protein
MQRQRAGRMSLCGSAACLCGKAVPFRELLIYLRQGCALPTARRSLEKDKEQWTESLWLSAQLSGTAATQ